MAKPEQVKPLSSSDVDLASQELSRLLALRRQKGREAARQEWRRMNGKPDSSAPNKAEES